MYNERNVVTVNLLCFEKNCFYYRLFHVVKYMQQTIVVIDGVVLIK